ncbi:MAG: hypothetical protein ACFFDH_13325 [Promethearchaeota archaeon]
MSSEESGNKHYVPFIGLLEDYVGRSPWDYYSWGHIAFGIAAFSIFSLIITIWEMLIGPATMPWFYILIFVLIVAVCWELIENTIIWRLHLKHENRRDSLINSLFDIIFVIFGGASTWLLKWIIMDLMGHLGRWFYLTALIYFLLILLAYFIGFFITNEETKKARKELGKLLT